jgi:hypothetical protein
MELIKKKIKDLINFSFAESQPDENISLAKTIKKVLIEHIVNELKILSKENNTILGRVIKFSVNDSYAYYVIVNIRDVNVDIVWLDYGKGYQNLKFTEFDTIPFDYANEKVQKEDEFEISEPEKISI